MQWMKRSSRPVASLKGTGFLDMNFEDGVVALLPRLRRFAAGLSRNLSEADDLCQMTIERALKARHQWAAGTRLDSWMYRIMRNLWIDDVRANKRRQQTFIEEEAGVDVGAPADQEARTELGFVDRALAKLPDEQREAVLLVMVEGYGYQEAADIIGCPAGTLSSRFVRGRDALHRLLEGEA